MLRLPKKTFKCLATVVTGLGLSMFANIAFADVLVVQPEQLRLSATRPVAEFQIRNTSAETTNVHFEVTRWQQEGDQELLTRSTKLMVLPENLKLEPGESGKVRVGLRLSGPWWEEEAFQILIKETPRIPDVGVVADYSPGRVTMRRAGVPVFLVPPGSANSRLTWKLERDGHGAVVLRVRNDGKAHVRMHSAMLIGPAGQSIHKRSISDVILPGGERTWELAPEATAGLWQLTADTNAGPFRVQLELDPDFSAATALNLGGVAPGGR